MSETLPGNTAVFQSTCKYPRVDIKYILCAYDSMAYSDRLTKTDDGVKGTYNE